VYLSEFQEGKEISDGTYVHRVNDGNIIDDGELCISAHKLVTDDCSHSGDPCGIPVGVVEILKFVSWM